MALKEARCFALSGQLCGLVNSQGGALRLSPRRSALGWLVAAPLGRKPSSLEQKLIMSYIGKVAEVWVGHAARSELSGSKWETRSVNRRAVFKYEQCIGIGGFLDESQSSIGSHYENRGRESIGF
jgi:hypothetical protein